MSVSDLYFIFAFLPIVILIYFLSRSQFRAYILFAFSLFFYACADIDHFVVMLVLTFINTVLGRLIYKKKLPIILLISGITLNVSFLCFFKYIKIIFVVFEHFRIVPIDSSSILMPTGISFFTFKSIAYLVDCYKGGSYSISSVLLYLTFFGQVQSGPISRISEFKDPKPDKDMFISGLCRFATGFGKKVLIANVLYSPLEEIFTTGALTTSLAWMGSVMSSLQLYYDFSGYSDMAIGLSRMFGYDCPENFKHPYTSASVSEFWRRWHITLGAWFRDYVYIPLGGSRSGKVHLALNLFIVWLLTGIWHGSSWNFIVWGLAYFAVILFEKLTKLPERLKNRLFKVAYSIFVMVFINFQWVIFRSADLDSGMKFIKTMFFSTKDIISDTRALVLFREYFWILLISVVFCFPVATGLKRALPNNRLKTLFSDYMYYIVIFFLFILSVSVIASGANNPFAYANF